MPLGFPSEVDIPALLRYCELLLAANERFWKELTSSMNQTSFESREAEGVLGRPPDKASR